MSGYPVILNGDHAEFERGHANTPPHERPDWPLPSFDARDWAKAFCQRFRVTRRGSWRELLFGADVDDEDLMVTWFANALMRGFDEHAARSGPIASEMLAALKSIMANVSPGGFDDFRRLNEAQISRIRDVAVAAIAKAESR